MLLQIVVLNALACIMMGDYNYHQRDDVNKVQNHTLKNLMIMVVLSLYLKVHMSASVSSAL